jgi:ubiquinone/menaquinone biosynthesis C-methylase UbiE
VRPEQHSQRQFSGLGRALEHPLARAFFEPGWRLAMQEVERHAPGRRFGRALDVGCGTGLLLRRLAPRCAQQVGLDLARPMLRLADAHRVQGTARRLTFRDASFDLVVSTHSFHHFEEPAQAVHELARVLMPSGLLVLVDLERRGLLGTLLDGLGRSFERSHVGLARAEGLRAMLEDAGLDAHATVRSTSLLPATCWSAVRPGAEASASTRA